jgi:hypothetical protein
MPERIDPVSGDDVTPEPQAVTDCTEPTHPPAAFVNVNVPVSLHVPAKEPRVRFAV